MDQAEEIVKLVVDRRTCHAPPILRLQQVRPLGHAVLFRLDQVTFIQDDSVPFEVKQVCFLRSLAQHNLLIFPAKDVVSCDDHIVLIQLRISTPRLLSVVDVVVEIARLYLVLDFSPPELEQVEGHHD